MKTVSQILLTEAKMQKDRSANVYHEVLRTLLEESYNKHRGDLGLIGQELGMTPSTTKMLLEAERIVVCVSE